MICQKQLRTNWNYVWCQTISVRWTFYQEVLGTIGALSNFRGVTVWGTGLWQELLRGRESIRQGSLQSGQLLKMQQHHYSLTQPRTSVSLTAFALDIYLSLLFNSFRCRHLFSFWYISLCSHSHHPSSFFSLPIPRIFYSKTGRGEPLSPPLCKHWPAEAFSLLFNIARHWSASATVLGQE